MRTRVRTLPGDDAADCGWTALLPALPPARRLASRQRADCVVLGAGFTGLAVARQLAALRPQWRVIVVEAQRVGDGASGRNSGFVVDVGHYDAARGVDYNRWLVRLGRAGVDHLRTVVSEGAIDCAWSERGRLQAAVGDVGMRELEHLRAGLEAMGEPYQELGAAAMRAATGSTHYRAGVRTAGGAIVQPAALVRGLAATLPASVELYEESPVRVVRQTSSFELDTCEGGVVADRLFLAADGFTAALGFLRRRVFPLLTFASLSRVLSDAERAALGGEGEWGLVAAERIGSTVRRTHDQRILIRNRVSYTPRLRLDDGWRRRVREGHRQAFRARFPMLPDVDFEYTWAGVMGMSLNGAHFFGRLGDRLFAAAGYNGVGVAMGSTAGRLLADLAVGADSELLAGMLSLPRPAWVPFEPLLRIGVPAVVARRTARAREEL